MFLIFKVFNVLPPPTTAATSSSSIAWFLLRRRVVRFFCLLKRRRSVSGVSVSSGRRSVSSRRRCVHCCRWGRVVSLLLLQDLFSRTVVLCVKMLTIKSHNSVSTDSTLIILLSGNHIMWYCKYILSNSTL